MAITSQGIVIGVETTPGGGTYTDIGEVSGWTGTGGGKAELDVTNLSSTAKEFIAGLTDNGTADVAIFFTDPEDAGQAILRANWEAPAASAINFEVTIGTRVGNFAGYVQNWNTSAAVDTPVSQDVTLRLTSEITWA
jgi:hypothetical protein